MKQFLSICALSALLVNAAFAQKATTKAAALKSEPGTVWQGSNTKKAEAGHAKPGAHVDGDKSMTKKDAMCCQPGACKDGAKATKWTAVDPWGKAHMTFKIFVPGKGYEYFANKNVAIEAFNNYADQGMKVGQIQKVSHKIWMPIKAQKA